MANSHEHDVQHDEPDLTEPIQRGYQPESVHVRAIGATGIALVLLAAFGLVVVAGIMWSSGDVELVPASKQWVLQETDPGVRPNQSYERQQRHVEWTEQLSSYGWADDDRQYARIPIERAIDILAREEMQVPLHAPGEQSLPPAAEEDE